MRGALVLSLLLASFSVGAVEGMNQRVLEAINEAQELIEAEDYQGALDKLSTVRKSRLTAYETAHVLRVIGMAYYESDRLEESIDAHEEALAQERLPDSMIANLLGSLGRLGLMHEDYAFAEFHLKRLLTIVDHDTPSNRALVAIAYLRQDKYVEAREMLLSAIEERRTGGGKPAENWLSMLASCHYALEEYAEMRGVVRDLVILYPRERYLMNLAALHGQLGERQRQLSLVESLLDDNRLEQENHLKMLANLFLAEGLPFKAARLLEKEIEDGRIEADIGNLEQLSQAWYLAHDLRKALGPLERAAAQADSGDLYMRLAGLYMDLSEWEAAKRAAGLALDLGSLRNEGNAWLLRGMASVSLKQLDDASRFFDRASDFDETRSYAAQWSAYVAQQRRVRASTQLSPRR